MTQSIQGIKIVPHTFQIDSVLQLQKLNPIALLQRIFPSQKTMKDTSTDGIQLQDLNELPATAFGVCEAVRRDDLTTLQSLVAQKAPLNKANSNGAYPIHIAAGLESPRLLQFLLRLGVDPYLKTNNQLSAFFVASALGRDENIKLLLKAGSQTSGFQLKSLTPLHAAAFNQHAGTMDLLLKRTGANKGASGPGGLTVLHIVSSAGDLEGIKVLLRHRVDLYQTDDQGRSAFMHASLQGKQEAMMLLLKNKADIDQANNQGRTALHEALLAHNNEVACFLIDNGASLHIKDINTVTPLQLIAKPDTAKAMKDYIGLSQFL